MHYTYICIYAYTFTYQYVNTYIYTIVFLVFSNHKIVKVGTSGEM